MSTSPELEVGFFKFNSFLDPSMSGPPALIPPEDIDSQACRVRIIYRPPRASDEEEDGDNAQFIYVWATIGLSKVRIFTLFFI